TNTITISGVTLDPVSTGSFTVTTDCQSLLPGASCNVFVKFTSPVVCAGVNGPFEGVIDVANNDPVLDGASLQFGVEGFGSDGNFSIKNLTDTTLTPDKLAAQLVGTGVQVSNVTYTGAAVAAGTFSTNTNIIGFNSGIVLSTGSVRSVVGPNCTDEIDGENKTAGDPQLDVILGAAGSSNDAAVLEFDFVPLTSSLTFQYVFASDEYNEFVGEFNDVFAFFLNNNNIALLPGITPPTPVSINTVNLTANPQFYINNDIDQLAVPPVDTEMDGLTVVLTATAQVVAGQTNHIKLAIADAQDFAVDSNVFIKAGSFTSSQIQLSPGSLDFGTQPQGTTSNPPKPITLTNTGNTSVTISSVVASAGFGESDDCVGTVPVNGTCTIQATFKPTTTGVISGTIQVNDDAAGSPQSVSLTGTGTAATATLVSIAVTPNPATVQVNGQVQFKATGTFSDQSTKDVTAQSTWTTGDTSVATINAATGLATGVAVTDGSISITATDGNIVGNALLTVTANTVTLTSVTVTPNPATVAVGGMIHFTATGHFSDGSTKDITINSNWTSSNPENATINSETGVAMGVAITDDPVTIRATAVGTGISGMALLTVSNVPIQLMITPPSSGSFGPVSPGGTLPVGVVLTADPGFTGDVTFSCTVTDGEGQPVSSITCKPDPNTVSITRNGPSQIAIVVETFCNGFLAPIGVNPGGLGGGFALLLFATMLAGSAWTYRKNPRWALSFALFVLIAIGGAACNSLPRGAGGATVPGDYILTISATVNGQTVSAAPVHFHVN
ncbi:MAG: choice-of-anchor L domain-containing protein, partial [bacterium]